LFRWWGFSCFIYAVIFSMAYCHWCKCHGRKISYCTVLYCKLYLDVYKEQNLSRVFELLG
jgi:hypothetical protein